jgi:hypothetical protein
MATPVEVPESPSFYGLAAGDVYQFVYVDLRATRV